MQNPWGLAPAVELHAWHLVVTFPSVRITSGKRSPAQNRSSGGVPGSLHLEGRAVDLAGPLDYLRAVSHYARSLRPVENLVHDVGSGIHLHLAW